MTDTASARRRIAAVAIGASAGGVEALSALLPALRPSCGVPVFIVVHMPRERPSLLASLFQSKCRLRVWEAQDKQRVEAGNIYFAPPDYHLLLDAGPQLALSIDDLVHFSRPSIDVLFESAADLYREQLLAIVLSGANQDGAAGLSAVARAGGLTLVQTPDTAVVSTMPASALKAAPASRVLGLDEIATLLGEIEDGTCRAAVLEARAGA